MVPISRPGRESTDHTAVGFRNRDSGLDLSRSFAPPPRAESAGSRLDAILARSTRKGYEHSGPERCAVRRIRRVKSDGRPPNTAVQRKPLSKINYRPESPITRNVESLNILSGRSAT